MRTVRTIYGLVLRLLPVALGVGGWCTARWLGVIAGVLLGVVLAITIWAVVYYVGLRSRLRRRLREVEAMLNERLTELASDPTSRDMGLAIGELENRGIEARPSLAAVCEFLTSADHNRRARGMSLLFAFYPAVWAQIAKGASSTDPPDVWRQRLAVVQGEG